MTSKAAKDFADNLNPRTLKKMARLAQMAATQFSHLLTEEEAKRFADFEAAIMNILELQD